MFPSNTDRLKTEGRQFKNEQVRSGAHFVAPFAFVRCDFKGNRSTKTNTVQARIRLNGIRENQN